MKWPLRNLLNPVVTRSLIYGTNSFDMEYVLQKIDNIKTMSGKEVKNVWFGEWERKALRYLEYAKKSENNGNLISAEKYYMLVAQCYYASYMINTDDIEQKRDVYKKLENFYGKSVSFRKNKTEYIEIPVSSINSTLPAYIHYPDDGTAEKYPCVITYSGIGSCKEELDMLVLPLIERGVAVITPDMPGTGSALFDYGAKCNGNDLEAAIEAIICYIDKRENIDSSRIANYGLCMGGGYSFHASAKNRNTKCCVSLFPLFISLAKVDSIPIWMKRGKWATFQHGESDDSVLIETMKVLEEGNIDCDFFMAYSADDNWMDREVSLKLLNCANGNKETLEVDEKPAYVSEETIMHAMPVGEQFHWVKHIASDFIADRLLEKGNG